MSLPSPNLDDRDFDQLVDEARQWIVRSCPEWTDLSPADPGIVLLEAFAHVTEQMIYRLNRVPEKMYIEFLRLIGLRMQPPIAASVVLRFSRESTEGFVEIPRGARVTTAGAGDGPPPVFVTDHRAILTPNETSVEVTAHHGEVVEGELIGVGTGLPGQQLTVARTPIVGPLAGAIDLVVGVESAEDEPVDGAEALSWQDRSYRLWREVADFVNLGDERHVYTTDRVSGTITFAPAVRYVEGDEGDGRPVAVAAWPANGREIRVWYRHGGGTTGNVAPGTLSVLRDPIPGVTVENPAAATGGRAAESIENAMLRGPRELRALDRAVTADDYELLARRASGIVRRAQAMTQVIVWAHAEPGTVEVMLVPDLPEAVVEGSGISIEQLEQEQTADALEVVQRFLDERRTLGATCVVKWTRYKPVHVCARVVVHQIEDLAAIEHRLQSRLHRTISPLPTSLNETGWPYGQPLHASDVYNILLSEPGVSYVDGVRLVTEDAPDDRIDSLEADPFQPDTWYAGEEHKIFRSSNDGEGWEVIERFDDDERVELLCVNPERRGLLAAVTRRSRTPEPEPTPASEPEADADAAPPPPPPPSPPPPPRPIEEWVVRVSHDCGERWTRLAVLGFRIRDCAWTLEAGQPALLIASDRGLHRLRLVPGTGPVQMLVDLERPQLALWAIDASRDAQGRPTVAVAAQEQGGVFVSHEGGGVGSFRRAGLEGEDVRVLRTQRLGPNGYLWAGLWTHGEREGTGAARLELRSGSRQATGAAPWSRFSRGWRGGSCLDLAFAGAAVYAATHHGGVLELSTTSREPAWTVPTIDCGLPMRDLGRFQPIRTVAARLVDETAVVLASGPTGVYRRDPAGPRYHTVSGTEFRERLTLPNTWLFCTSEHQLEVITEDEARRS